MPKVTTPGPAATALPFEDHVRAVAQQLRIALADLLAGVGADPARPLGMARHLGLDKSLSWKISKVITEENPFEAIAHLPGRSGLSILLRLLERAGAAAPAIDEVRIAVEGFERLVEAHAGDRDTLEIMLAGLTDAAPDEAHRKLAYIGSSAALGVQARVQLAAHIVAPSERSDLLDLAVISGLVGFRRLRRGVPWTIACIQPHAGPRGQPPEPLDPAAPGAAPLLTEYCSSPLPGLRVARGNHGSFELADGPLGSTAATTCITGYLRRTAIPRFPARAGAPTEHAAALTTPADVGIHDLLIHDSLRCSPAVRLFSQLPGGLTRTPLPIGDALLDLGSPPYLVTPELPRYHQLLESACARLGHPLADFHAYRLRLRYPPIPALSVFSYDLAPEV
jgi:hypothetical protein